MKCLKCGNIILDENTFCTKCGWCKDDILRKKIKTKKVLISVFCIIFCLALVFIINEIRLNNKEPIRTIKLLSDYDSATLIDDIAGIQFGAYPQSDMTAEKLDPIEWVVLDRDIFNHKALLISKYILDSDNCNLTNEKGDGWENSNIRRWLNNDFYDAAFNDLEKERILSTKLINKDNEDYDTIAGEDTTDKIFFLSIAEAKKYFKSDKNESYRDQLGLYAATKGSEFAKKGVKTKYNKRQNNLDFLGKGNRESNKYIEEGKDWAAGFSDYWLRTPGGAQKVAACIKSDAYLDTGGVRAYAQFVGIRPAMWIKY